MTGPLFMMRFRSLLLLLLLLPITKVWAGNGLIEDIDAHEDLIAVVYSKDGLKQLVVYRDSRVLWSSAKYRYLEYNWSSRGALAVRLCDGPCYNMNRQMVQVFDPLSMVSWNSSEGRLARFWWSSSGKLAVVIWKSPCGDYSEHWIEVYDPITGRTSRSEKKGYLYVIWSPDGRLLAATVKGDRGYYVEVLDSRLNKLWSSYEAGIADFKWSKDGKLAVRLQENGTQWIEAYVRGTTWRSERAKEVRYDWTEDGRLVYSLNGELRMEGFLTPDLIFLLIAVVILLIIAVVSVKLVNRRVGISCPEEGGVELPC